MMFRRSLLVVICQLTVQYVTAQEAMLEDIGRTLRAGSSHELINYFPANVKLQLNTPNTVNYTKNQAEMALKKFFDEFPPEDFRSTHKGSTANGFVYQIGQYISVNQLTYKVYMLLKQENGIYYVDTLTISR